MRRIGFVALGSIAAVAASVAAAQVMTGQTQEVIEITVSADELQECRETLAQVASMPAVHDNGTPILFDASSDLPSVRCVVGDV
ncbi:hypothetical protein ATO8_15718 [Roseivivax marinus]|jgi:hypothetical protein|uniref:Uncharacterized protein n=1 Tax=Roseivivax marinus TaxID=1379903 RepID=W4HG79_9RHOB|nr:hypothetical protein [Roseivivax marinus]ETW11709.1 hypothetical protein ATO8_15718 [Roseivivax marinus]SEL46143.1 hypothetical protein SAMN05444413_109105 [Roseivivax marinus]